MTLEEAEKHRVYFKIATLYPTIGSDRLEMCYNHKNGSPWFLDSSGVDHMTVPQAKTRYSPGEQVHTIYTDRPEKYVFNGKEEMRLFATLSYLPIEPFDYESLIKNQADKLQNIINRKVHSAIQTHPQVKITDENGNNCNINQGMAKFVLIEESKDLQAKNLKEDMITKYRAIVADIYNNNRQDFLDLCYAYGIGGIDTFPPDELRLEMIYKINMNPKSFEDIYTHKQKELLILFKRAQFVQDDITPERTVVWQDPENRSFYVNGEIIGTDEDTCLNTLKSDQKIRETVQRKMGIQPREPYKETINQPIVDAQVLTERQLTGKAANDQADKTKLYMAFGRFLKEYSRLKNSKDIDEKQIAEGYLRDAIKEKFKSFAHMEGAFNDYKLKKLYENDLRPEDFPNQ